MFAVVLITGGQGIKSAEIYLAESNISCTLPDLPMGRFDAKDHHTQNNGLACGGWAGLAGNNQKSCVEWKNGNWTLSHNNSLSEMRWGHVSWATGSGVYLMGGYWSGNTTELVKEDGSVEAGIVSLKYMIQ